MSEPIKSVGVAGAGTMGSGITHVLLRAGYTVVLTDASPQSLAAGSEKIVAGLARDVEKGRLTDEARQQALGRIETSAQLDAVSPTDFVIEAVTENFDVKAEVFRKLEVFCPSEVMFATNTSSISVTRLAATTERPARFLGMHFFNPAAVMKLVEVVAGVETLPETAEAACQFARSLGKIPVRVNDSPGFVSNRLLMPMINEAVYAVMEGVAEPEAVDEVMKLGMNHPMGPLELADFIGLDVCLDIMQVLYDGFRDSKYRPCPLLEKMVYSGRLGRKSRRGFYDYSTTQVGSITADRQ